MHTRAAFQPCKIDRRGAVRPRRQTRSPAPTVAFAVSLSVGASAVAVAGPTGGVVVQGQGTISTPATGQTVINQSSQQLSLNWNTFNVSANESVRFNQPSSSAIAFNHILDQNPSQIFGSLSANGKVVLINPNGLLIGRTATLNVSSLVVSSLDAIDFDPTSGRYRFSATRTDPGAVINEGAITAQRGGSVTLLGGSVSNSGTIVADYGTVNLAAGRVATLDLAGDGLLRLEVGGDLTDNPGGVTSAVENSGNVQANGGQVVLTANAVKNVFANLVNNTGVVRANRIDNTGGTIELLGPGGTVESSGTLDASAGDAVSTGGSVQVLGDRVGLMDNAVVNVSGATGGGTALIGGDQHGANPEVLDATDTYVSPGATINADAGARGDGGHVVVWSNEFTNYGGSLSARGGSSSGDGGSAEVSGKQTLNFNGAADLTAAQGARGTLLLDPTNITIDGSTTQPSSNPFTASSSTTIGSQGIQTLLQTANVSLTAPDDITETGAATAIVAGGSTSLALNAGGNLKLTNNISIGGELDLAAGGNFNQASGTLLSSNSKVVVTAANTVATGTATLDSITAPEIDVTAGAIAENPLSLLTAGTVKLVATDGDIGTSSASADISSNSASAVNISADASAAANGNVYILANTDATLVDVRSGTSGGGVTVFGEGNLNVKSVTASSNGGVMLQAPGGAIRMAPGGGPGISGGSISLHAGGNIGTLTGGQVANYSDGGSVPIPVAATTLVVAQSTSNSGIINLQLNSPPTFVSAAVPGTTSGAILLQSGTGLDTTGWGPGAIQVGSNGTVQVGLVVSGVLKLSSTDSLTDNPPGILMINATDVTSNGSNPRSFPLSAGIVLLNVNSPGGAVDPVLNQVSQLSASIGNNKDLNVTQSTAGTQPSLTLNTLSTGGNLSVATRSPIISTGTTVLSGLGVTLQTNGTGDTIVENGTVTAGSNGITLATTGTGSGITINSGLSTGGAPINVSAADPGSGITLASQLNSSGNISVTAGNSGTGGTLTLGSGYGIVGDGNVTLLASSIGSSATPLALTASKLNATATSASGGIFVSDNAALEVTGATASGAVNIVTTGANALTVDAASGNGVTLTGATGLLVQGAVSGGANGVTLSAQGNNSAIDVTAAGSLTAGAGGVTASATGTDSDVAFDGGVTVTGGGSVTATANRAIRVAAVSGAAVTLQTTGTDTGTGVTVNGTVNSTGTNGTTVNTAGTIATGASGSIGGNTKVALTGSAIGSGTSSRVTTATPTLNATSINGSIYLQQQTGDLDLTATAGGGGAVDALTRNGTLTAEAITSNGLTLSAAGTAKNLVLQGPLNTGSGDVNLQDTGAGGNIDVNTAISGGPGISLTASTGTGTGGGINLAAPLTASSSVTLTADGAIVDPTAQSINTPTLFVSGGSIGVDLTGTNVAPLVTSAPSDTLSSNTGGIYLTQNGGIAGLSATSAGALHVTTSGQMTIAGASGTVVDLNAATLVVTSGTSKVSGSTSVTVQGSEIGVPGSAFNTDTPSLFATSTAGGILVQQLIHDLSLTATAPLGQTVAASTGTGSLTVLGASGTGVTLTSGDNLTVDGGISGGTSGVTLQATGAILATANNASHPITGSSLIASGTSIGAPGAQLVTDVPSITTTATSATGSTYVLQPVGDLAANITDSGGAVDIETQGGSLTENSLTGTGLTGVTLIAGGAGKTLTVANGLTTGAGGLTLEATGDGGNVSLNGPLATTGVLTVTAGTNASRGVLGVGGGVTFAGNQVNLAAQSLGSNLNPLVTAAGTALSAQTSNGDIYITQSGAVSLAANAIGGAANVNTQNGSLTVTSATGTNVALTAGGAGSGIAVDGAITATGGVQLVTGGGAITAGAGNQINATTLVAQGSAVGATNAPLVLNVGALQATASNGGIFAQDSGALSLTASATGGPVDVSAGGALSVVSAVGNGLALSTGAVGTNFLVNGTMNGGAGPVTLVASGAGSSITLDGAINSAANVTLTATSAVNVNSAINTTAGVALTATQDGGAVTVAAPVSAATDLTVSASGAGGTINLSAPLTTPAAVSLTAGTTVSPGSIVAGPGVQISAGSLTATAMGIGTSTAPLQTTVGTLNASGQSGGVYVANTGDLMLTANATGAVDVSTAGALNVATATGSAVALTASGAITESNGAVITAPTVSLSGASIGTSASALRLAATSLTATGVTGGIYVQQQSGPLRLTANAADAIDVQTSGQLTVAGASGNGPMTLTTTSAGAAIDINGAVADGAGPVALNAAGAITDSGGQITASTLTASGTSIGTAASSLLTSVGTLNATASNGGIFVAQLNKDLTLTASATGGSSSVTSTGGAIDVVSAAGNGVTLATSGAGESLTVNGTVNGGAGAVALSSGGDLVLNNSVGATGAASLAAGGAITVGTGVQVTGSTITASGASIGSSSAPLFTNTASLDATGTSGGVFIKQTNGLALTANATGLLQVQTGGALTVSLANGDGVALSTTDQGSSIALNGVVNVGNGAVALSTPGAISAGNGEQINAATLSASGSAIGSAATPLSTHVGALTATSTNGGVYVNNANSVTLIANASGGAVDVQTANGAITVDGASGNGITLASSGTGAGIIIGGAIDAGSGDVTLNAGTGAITDSSGSLVSAANLTATGGSVGSGAASLQTAVTALTATAGSGDIDVRQQSGLKLQSLQAAGNIGVVVTSGDISVGNVTATDNVSLTATAGKIKDTDAKSGVTGNTVTLAALSIGAPATLTGTIPDATPRLNTNATNLVATSTAGGVYINQLTGLASATVHASGGADGNIELLTSKGDLNIQSITASGTLLLAAGANIYDLPGASPIAAQAAELRAGGSDLNGGHIGTLSHPLVLQLSPGNSLRMFVPQTINPNSASSGPATLPSAGVQSTLSTFISPSLLALTDGFGQFQGLGETQFTSQAELLVRSIQNQTATVQSVVGLDWSSFDPNVSLFGKLDPAVCLPGDQRDEEAGAPGAADHCVAK